MNTPVPISTETLTMSSREIAELVEARHNDVIVTIERLFSKGLLRTSRKSRKEATGGRPIEVYDLIQRDTHLVIAGYSDEHRAKVIDRWQELEQQIANPQPAIPQTLPEALRLAATLAEEKAQAMQERDEAVRTKAEIGARREATALARASAEKRRADKLAIQLEKSEQWFTIKRVEAMQGKKFNWRELKRTSLEMGYPIEEAFDANYGHVKAYHKDIWRQVYQVKL